MKYFLALACFLLSGLTSVAQNCSTPPPNDGKVYPWCYTPNVGTDWDTTPYKAYIINGMRFRLLFPQNYDSSGTQTYPLIVFFHGLGQHGTDNNLQLKIGGINHIRGMEAGRYNGFVMVPQADNEYWASYEKPKILAFINQAIDKLRVDPFRVHAEGYSAGAAMAWALTVENPKVFATLVSMSYAKTSTATADAQVLRYKSVWHAQGGLDQAPTPTAGNHIASAFRAIGANYRYVYYPELGHGTWWQTWSERDFFPHLNTNSILDIHARFFKSNFCEGEAVEGIMGVQSGFEGYEWRFNGQTLPYTAHEIPFDKLGNYTVRIRRNGQWSPWSEPLQVKRVGPSARPTITTSGPTALPTPDGRTTVTLYAPLGKESYRWSTGSTADSLVVSQAGSYSVSVTDPLGCPSAYSAPVQVTYNASGQLEAPSQLRVAPGSETALKLEWTDNSKNESGFELYRSLGPNGPWQLVQTFGPNTQNALNDKLIPNRRYYYQLRAVNSSGSSGYALGNGRTAADAEAPGIPQNLQAGLTTNSSIGLYWQAPPANSSEDLTYEIYANDTFHIATTRKTTYTVNGLPEKQHFRFKVRALDAQGNASGFSNQLNASTYRNGLFYTFYEGELASVHDVSLLTPKKYGYLNNFIVDPQTKPDSFAYTFEGTLYVPKKGVYTFVTRSKDGSILNLDGRLLVYNDFQHELQERSGTIELESGLHPIKVVYFSTLENSPQLEVLWKGADFAYQPIADSLFTDRYTTPDGPAAPSQVSVQPGGNFSALTQWQAAANVQTEIYRRKAKGTYYHVGTAGPGLTQFTDIQLEAGQTYQYALRTVNAAGSSALVYVNQQGDSLRITTGAGTLLAPDSLSAVLTAEGYGALRWLDRSATEKQYEIWRSRPGQTFAKLATLPANQQSYFDLTVGNSNNVQYRIRAINGAQQSDWSATVVLDRDNKAPVLSGLPQMLRAAEGDTTTYTFELYDPEGRSLALNTSLLPSFMHLSRTSEKQVNLLIYPTAEHIGLHQNLQISASDSLLLTDWVFDVNVYHSQKTATYINFGDRASPQPWNVTGKLSGSGGSQSLSGITNEFGEQTGYTIAVSGDWGPIQNWGATAGPANATFPNAVSSQAYTVPPNKSATVTLSGLAANKRYNLVFFGSSIYRSFNGHTQYRVGGESVQLAVQSNLANTAQLNGLQAEANGTITIVISGAEDASKGAFLNALIIEEYDAENKLLRPDNLWAESPTTESVVLHWKENARGEDEYEIWRRTLPTGEFSKVGAAPANAQSYTDSDLRADTGYEYKIRARQASAYSDYSKTVAVATLQTEILINANYTLNARDPWNNLDREPVTGLIWHDLENAQTQSSGVHLTLVQNFDGQNPFGPTAGNEGIYHENVIKTFYFTEVGTVARLQLYGLDDELEYTLRFFGASAFEGGESGVTYYTVNNQRVSLDVEHNISNTVAIRSLQPRNGTLQIDIEAGAFARYGFLNAMEIEISDPARTNAQLDLNQLVGEQEPDGTEEEGAVSDLIVYPNPYSASETGILQLNLYASTAGAYEIVLADARGRILLRQMENFKAGKNKEIKVELGNRRLLPGLYILRVLGNDNSGQSRRLIIKD